MKKLIKKLINLPQRAVYQAQHIFWMCKIAKKHFQKIPLSFLIHDLDKIFLLRDKQTHREKAHHHLTFLICQENQKYINYKNVIEMICDWETARFFKQNKTLSAREYFEKAKTKYCIPNSLEKLIEETLDLHNF